jgi:3D (Asp-Asp-Asp) domain-containing protein
MKKKLLSLAASAAIFSAAATSVLADQVDMQKNKTLLDFPNQYEVTLLDFPNQNEFTMNIWNHLSSNIIDPLDIFTDVKMKPLLKLPVKLDLIENMKANGQDNQKNAEPAENKETKKNEQITVIAKSEDQNNADKEYQDKTVSESTVTEKQNNDVTQIQDNAGSIDQSEAAAPASAETETAEPEGKEITVTATAYTADCEGCSGITKTGVNLEENPDAKVIAVDPAVIPLGSKVHVEGYGYATAEDIGGGIDGNEIDVYVPDENDAMDWGRKQVKVTIID